MCQVQECETVLSQRTAEPVIEEVEMERRFLRCMRFRGIAGFGAMLLAVTLTTPATGQALSSTTNKPAVVNDTKAKTWTLARTPDGQPDLQGVWTNASSVPLERPKNLGAKEFYTEQEAAEVRRKFAEEESVQVNAAGVALPEAHYDLSQFGLNRAQSNIAPNLRTSLIVGPEGRIPPMTEEGKRRNAARAAAQKGHEFDSAQNRPLQERCIVWAAEGPPMLPSTYNNNLEIIQTPGYVAILNEMIHDTRIIPLDGRPHVSPDIRLWRGDSRGHWEGNTLVVDTTNFTGKTAFQGSSENLHVVERFTRTGPGTILYEFTVEDPSTWTKPWSAQIVMAPALGAIYEYACHEGNYGLANNLRGARVEEKAAAEAASK
jgi:hypothetical protein